MIDPATITTVRVDELPLDSLHLTDLFPFETSDQILKQNTIQSLVDFLAPLVSALQFEQKTLHVNQSYIDNNFDNTGLGKNLCVGFAICNGQNGTPNLDGQVEIGYGAVNSNIGSFGGEKTHTLLEAEMPVHSHTVADYAGNSASSLRISSPTATGIGGAKTSTKGGGNPHNNMQPYLVSLKIMKL